MTSPVQPVLSFDAVSAAEGANEVRDLSLLLLPGERVLIEAGEELRQLLADLAGGLEAPDHGEVLFAGESWHRLSATAQSRLRRRIGWIFPEPAWLYNLDIDENISLSERFHGDRPPAEIDEEAEALARSLGLRGLPRMRPAWASARERIVSQWVRALLGGPALLVADSGAEEASDPDFAPLWSELDARREQGLAVLWLSHRNPTLEQAGALNARCYVLENGTLRQTL